MRKLFILLVIVFLMIECPLGSVTAAQEDSNDEIVCEFISVEYYGGWGQFPEKTELSASLDGDTSFSVYPGDFVQQVAYADCTGGYRYLFRVSLLDNDVLLSLGYYWGKSFPTSVEALEKEVPRFKMVNLGGQDPKLVYVPSFIVGEIPVFDLAPYPSTSVLFVSYDGWIEAIQDRDGRRNQESQEGLYTPGQSSEGYYLVSTSLSVDEMAKREINKTRCNEERAPEEKTIYYHRLSGTSLEFPPGVTFPPDIPCKCLWGSNVVKSVPLQVTVEEGPEYQTTLGSYGFCSQAIEWSDGTWWYYPEGGEVGITSPIQPERLVIFSAYDPDPELYLTEVLGANLTDITVK